MKLRADRDRLTQVLANLLSNAAKFSPRGELVRVAALVKSLRAASVKLPIIIASERASALRAELRDEDIADWLDKPFTREQLVEAVHRALVRSSRDKEFATLGPIV